MSACVIPRLDAACVQVIVGGAKGSLSHGGMTSIKLQTAKLPPTDAILFFKASWAGGILRYGTAAELPQLKRFVSQQRQHNFPQPPKCGC